MSDNYTGMMEQELLAAKAQIAVLTEANEQLANRVHFPEASENAKLDEIYDAKQLESRRICGAATQPEDAGHEAGSSHRVSQGQ